MINELLKRYPLLAACKSDIEKSKEAIISCYKSGGKLLLCGNGGSSADCDHIVGELMKGFLKLRPLSKSQKEKMTERCRAIDDETLSKLQLGLPAISLSAQTSLTSAFCNDVDPTLVYAQATLALGKENDVLIAISTSGNSKNVINAVKIAKSLGLTVIALSGNGGGSLSDISDICISVPENETFKIQELHLPVYHYLCASVEDYFF